MNHGQSPVDAMHLQTQSFSANLSIPSISLFQLVKNKKEAATLLTIRHNAEKLDIFTSQLVMELQQRELIQESLRRVMMNINHTTHAMLPLISEAATVNRRRAEIIWRGIQDTMSDLSRQFQDVKRFQDMNKAIALELFAVSRELAQQKLILAKAEKLLMDKIEHVLDGSDPYGLTLDNWESLFPSDKSTAPSAPKSGPPPSEPFITPQAKPNPHGNTSSNGAGVSKWSEPEIPSGVTDGALPGAKRRKIDDTEQDSSKLNASFQPQTNSHGDGSAIVSLPSAAAAPNASNPFSFASYRSLNGFEDNPSQIALPAPVGLDDDDDRPVLSSRGSNLSNGSASKLDYMDEGEGGSLVDYPDSSDPSQRQPNDLMSQ